MRTRITKSLSVKLQMLNLTTPCPVLIGRLRLLRAGFQHVHAALARCECSCCVSDALRTAVYTKMGSVKYVCIDCLTRDTDVMSTEVCVCVHLKN